MAEVLAAQTSSVDANGNKQDRDATQQPPPLPATRAPIVPGVRSCPCPCPCRAIRTQLGRIMARNVPNTCTQSRGGCEGVAFDYCSTSGLAKASNICLPLHLRDSV